MDADYDPTAAKRKLVENTIGKKNRKRKSKVAEALSRPKPNYDPKDKNYERYFDEYYKLDCEDIIGDIPCRFKYREVIPNDFGLTIDEILLAKDKELNKWCSLKKAVQHRPAQVEKYDQIAYAKKANNINLKRRIIPSLFSEEPDDNQDVQKPSTSGQKRNDNDRLNTGTTIIDENEFKNENNSTLETNDNKDTNKEDSGNMDKKENKKKKKKKKNLNNASSNTREESQPNKDGVSNSDKRSLIETKNGESNKLNNENKNNKKKNRKRKNSNSDHNKEGGKKFKKNKKPVDVGMSDARLTAFGINPKKYKNKLMFGNKNKD